MTTLRETYTVALRDWIAARDDETREAARVRLDETRAALMDERTNDGT